ncbi:MAG: hypothetical protein K8L99_18090 [Anaerolineae bacterium]|nr:hypothetical protein [Anaerolineae bacterium]
MATQNKTERLVYRLLFLAPPAEKPAGAANSPARAERAFGFSVVFSGVRCILQYVLLPFVLPLLGFTVDAALPIMVAINVIALVSILYSVRRFWAADYRYKWQYLPIAVVATVLLTFFLISDLRMLIGI